MYFLQFSFIYPKMGKWSLLKSALLCIFFISFHNSAISQVLNCIEEYKAPDFSDKWNAEKEVYDFRLESGVYVPPNLTETFICDIYLVLTNHFNVHFNHRHLPDSIIYNALNHYKTHSPHEIAGYRPWTHTHFIKGLTDKELSILTIEILEYIRNYSDYYELTFSDCFRN